MIPTEDKHIKVDVLRSLIEDEDACVKAEHAGVRSWTNAEQTKLQHVEQDFSKVSNLEDWSLKSCF